MFTLEPGSKCPAAICGPILPSRFVVYVREENLLTEAKPIEWLLLTSAEVETAQQAMEIEGSTAGVAPATLRFTAGEALA